MESEVVLLHDGGLHNLDVNGGTGKAAHCGVLDPVHHIHALDNFSEHGVLAVEMRCATNSGVGINLLISKVEGRCGNLVLDLLGKAVLQGFETGIVLVLVQFLDECLRAGTRPHPGAVLPLSVCGQERW